MLSEVSSQTELLSLLLLLDEEIYSLAVHLKNVHNNGKRFKLVNICLCLPNLKFRSTYIDLLSHCGHDEEFYFEVQVVSSRHSVLRWVIAKFM